MLLAILWEGSNIMKTPIVTVFIVAVLIIGLGLAFYDYKTRGLHENPIGISRTQAEMLRRARVVGEEKANQKDYVGAVEEYKRAIRISPRDPYIRNDLGAAYYYLGLKAINPPIPEDEETDYGSGSGIDARYGDKKEQIREQAFTKLKEALDKTESGIITVVVRDSALSKEIVTSSNSLGNYAHAEEEVKDDGVKDYWITIIKGKTKDYFIVAEKEYLQAVDFLAVRDSAGHKYSAYSVASRNLGTLYFRMGRKKEALANWQRALQLEPADQDLRKLVDSYRK